MESVLRPHRSLARLFDLVSFSVLVGSVRLQRIRFRLALGTEVGQSLGCGRSCGLCFGAARTARFRCAADEKAGLEKVRPAAQSTRSLSMIFCSDDLANKRRKLALTPGFAKNRRNLAAIWRRLLV